MKLIMNLSMVGEKPTGLGVYSLVCARVLSSFRSGIIGRRGQWGSDLDADDGSVVAPPGISIGSGKFSALRRSLWLRRLNFDAETLVYSPTHHGLGNQYGQVITLHDMICLRFPWQHPLQYLYFKFYMPRLLKRCRAVFTVSETTKADIAETYGYPADGIHVVPNSVDSKTFRPGNFPPSSDFLLMVGARYSHKNVAEVLENHASWSSHYRLVVTSCSGRYRRELDGLIAKLGLADSVQFYDYVSLNELIGLYQNCAALIYPSKWEGFGIPPLEALACGRPVIVSDIPVHREVLSDSAIYVTLGSTESWVSAFEVLRDSLRVEQMVGMGRERVQHFSSVNALKMLRNALLTVEPDLEMR